MKTSEDYEDIMAAMARDLAAVEPDHDRQMEVLRRYVAEHAGLRDWLDGLILRIAPIMARQRELEQRLADLEARVEELELMVRPPTRH